MTHRAVRGFALVVLASAVFLVGCGSDTPAQTTLAPDRSAEIQKLQKRLTALEERATTARRKETGRPGPGTGPGPGPGRY